MAMLDGFSTECTCTCVRMHRHAIHGRVICDAILGHNPKYSHTFRDESFMGYVKGRGDEKEM